MTVEPHVQCQHVLEILDREGFDQIPVTDSSGVVLGIVTLGNLMACILNKKVGMGDPVSKVRLGFFFNGALFCLPMRKVEIIVSLDYSVKRRLSVPGMKVNLS